MLSPWVRDSLLIRWAELGERLAAADRKAAPRNTGVLEQALRVMLEPAVPERDTRHAREIFAGLRDSAMCVAKNAATGAFRCRSRDPLLVLA